MTLLHNKGGSQGTGRGCHCAEPEDQACSASIMDSVHSGLQEADMEME